MKKILITGVNGQVGWELQRVLAPLGQVIALTREQLDLSQPEVIRKVVRAHQPDIILNPAAYTAVDKAESEASLAMQVNGIAPGILAEEAKNLDALLIHYSTDYVFDGTKNTPYCETDLPNPQSVYGKTKLAGELAIRAVGSQHLILRTSWVYGVHGGNFVKTILRLAKERSELRIVADQFGAPTSAHLIAQTTLQILQGKAVNATQSGVYHLTASGRTNWHQYAQEIVRLAQQYDVTLAQKALTIHPIATHEYPLPAPRPRNSVLATETIKQTFNVDFPVWNAELAQCMRQLYAN